MNRPIFFVNGIGEPVTGTDIRYRYILTKLFWLELKNNNFLQDGTALNKQFNGRVVLRTGEVIPVPFLWIYWKSLLN